MQPEDGKNKNFHLLAVLAVVVLCVWQSDAQRLAIRTFQTGDGLAHNSVNRIFQDAKGYLWLATNEGLCRFDGYDFTDYGTGDGLGQFYINDVTADKLGRLWTATNGGGVSMLIDEPPENSAAPRRKFVSFQIADGGENNNANLVNRILFDAENRLWCVTDDGLYRAKSLDVASGDFEQVVPGSQPVHTNAALLDRRGRLWFGVKYTLVQITGSQTTIYEIREADENDQPTEIHTLIEDGNGRILAAGLNGIYEFIEPAADGARGTWRKLPFAGQATRRILSVAAAPDGGLWLGANGLLRLKDGQPTHYTTANGLSANIVRAIFYDREGILWLGTNNGLSKLTGESVIAYTVAQGLPAPDVYRVIEDRAGRMYAQIGGCRLYEIAAESRIVPLFESVPIEKKLCSAQLLLQDARGNWWFHAGKELKFSAGTEPDARRGATVRDETGAPVVHTEMYEDSEGSVWLTSLDTGKLYRSPVGAGPRLLIAAENVPAEYIIRDRNSGTLWLTNRSQLWRIRNGRTEEIRQIENLPVLQPRCLYQDSRGRIWIGTRYHGAVVTDAPDADVLHFSRYTTREGLASDTVWQVAEDVSGEIYFGTGRGVDRLDAESGKIHHFTAGEGAIDSQVFHLLRDKQGNIWVSTTNGLMRINPRGQRQHLDAPPIFISQIRVAGEELPLAETGAAAIPYAELTAAKNNVAIRFVGLSFQSENALRYEYRLDGVDADWVSTGSQREVNFANLGAGDYRFQVRAVNAENIASPRAAVFEFRILRPVYLRAWFLALAAVLAGLLIYAIYRTRLQRLLEIERTRTRIATDLHDDIGANLSKISLLSEIVKMQMTDGEPESRRMLTTIAEVSRSSVGAMRDIVWAINPHRDSVLEMTRKMRQHAEETFVPNNVSVKFDAPADGADLKLSMDVRRELLLIFKEAVNNAARHSGCSRVEIVFEVAGGGIFLRIADDGRGFDASQRLPGNGLTNMKARAEKLGGRFEIDSENGTIVTIKI
jgi:signal transduction histidine kinase/ligand-binding sensor domain-containing protein